MPKPMIKAPQTQEASKSTLSITDTIQQKKQTTEIDKMKLDRLLRKSRSKEYMEMMHKLDAGGHVCNKHKVDEIINTIKEEFPEVEIEGILLGCVSVCYLGKPYEVHILDMMANIVEHYEAGRPLPGGLEKARSLAMRGGYEFIEVYVDCCRCVSASGAVSVVYM